MQQVILEQLYYYPDMSITTPSKADPDTELVSSLDGRHKNTLHRLFEACRDDSERNYNRDAFNTKEWQIVLANEYPDRVRQFTQIYQRMRDENIRRKPVIEHLAERTDIPAEELEIERLPEIIPLLMEHELLDRLEEIIVAARFRPSAVTGTYKLDKELDLNNLGDRIAAFHRSWNQSIDEDETKRAKRVEIEYESEQTAALQYYRESTETKARYFSFRKDEFGERLEKPEIEEFPYRQLKRIRLLIVSRDGESRLIFTKNINGWKQSLRTLFDEIFGVDNLISQMSRPGSEVAAGVEETASDDVSADSDPLTEAQTYIDERCEIAKDEVDDLGIPSDDKQTLKTHLDNITISGTEVDGDRSIATRELRIISQSNLAELFASVDIEDGFRDLLRKADSEKLGFVLDVNDVPVECINGEWSRTGPGGLPDDIRRALNVFFDEESYI